MDTDTLNTALKELNLSLNKRQCNDLLEHLTLLIQWNKKFNLTTIPENQMIIKHCIDSLSIAQYIENKYPTHTIVDVGTGAGFPGIPLSIALPTKKFYLIDSVQKKCIFLNQVKLRLNLKNLTVIHKRIEDWISPDENLVIVSRAFANPQKLWQTCSRHIKQGSKILAMITKKSQEQLTSLNGANVKFIPLKLPHELNNHGVLEIIKK